MDSSGLRLREFLKHEGIEQKKVASDMGVSAAYINALCIGKKQIGKNNAMKLQNLYGVNAGWLLTGLGNMRYEAYSTEMVEQARGRVSEEEPATRIPSWANSLIQIIASQIKENEALHRELRQTIQEVNALKEDLQTIIQQLKSIKS